uniref:Uncharacterized protein n=1 Tax=Panagrolaimus sp. ES5 TaxID=591445 RepID=A0AC34F8P9_9BILA
MDSENHHHHESNGFSSHDDHHHHHDDGGHDDSINNGPNAHFDYLKGCSFCLDTTKSAADKAVNVASYTAALSIGLAVVATQMGVIATTSAVNAFLASLLYTKQAGSNALESASNARSNVENIIHSAIEQSQKMAKVPAEKANEHANSFLDIANAVFDRLLGLPEASEPSDSSISDRILFLSNRVTGSLLTRFNTSKDVEQHFGHLNGNH